MNAKAFHHTVISYTKDLAKYSRVITALFNADAIHELRTSFKKLRALLRWQKVDKKLYVIFKPLYAAAGEIRNIQVAKEMLKKEKATPQVFKNQLSIMLVKRKEAWNKIYHKKIPAQLRDAVERLEISPTKHKKFFFKRIERLHQIVHTSRVADDKVHEARKMVKDMQYVLGWWEKRSKASTDFIKQLSNNRLKEMEEDIGRYNDKCSLLILLIAYTRQEKDPALINEIRPLIAKWQRDKLLHKKKLMANLRSSPLAR